MNESHLRARFQHCKFRARRRCALHVCFPPAVQPLQLRPESLACSMERMQILQSCRSDLHEFDPLVGVQV
jgi:hypothetical protein